MTPEAFLPHRKHLFSVAYRMLGTASEADDIVQDAYLRAHQVDEKEMQSVKAYLTKVVVHLCLDSLGSARARRETYVGPWLPEPILTDEVERDPMSVSFAFLLVLETLSPLERAVFLLREVFDYQFSEMAELLGKTEPALRKVLERARVHVEEGTPRYRASTEEHERLLREFGFAALSGDIGKLEVLFAEKVVAHNDGGGKVKAARKLVIGANLVARFFDGLTKKGHAKQYRVRWVSLNGMPALALWDGEVLDNILTVRVEDGKIADLFCVRNPDKLARLGAMAECRPE